MQFREELMLCRKRSKLALSTERIHRQCLVVCTGESKQKRGREEGESDQKRVSLTSDHLPLAGQLEASTSHRRCGLWMPWLILTTPVLHLFTTSPSPLPSSLPPSTAVYLPCTFLLTLSDITDPTSVTTS